MTGEEPVYDREQDILVFGVGTMGLIGAAVGAHFQSGILFVYSLIAIGISLMAGVMPPNTDDDGVSRRDA